MFCIVAYLLNKRVDLKIKFEEVILKHIQLINQIESGLVLNRICMMLYFSGEFLFLDDEDTFKTLLFVLFKCINP